MPEKALYTADMHGNEIQYQKLVNYGIKIHADIIIIGGDITPKITPFNTCIKNLKNQRDFLQFRLPELLNPLKQKLPKSRLFILMGNDDCSVNMDILKNNDSELYQIIHNKRINLTEKYDIVGYSYVPITPFGMKDWEKYDLTRIPIKLKQQYLKRIKTSYRLEGFKSTLEGLQKFNFSSDIKQENTIQNDLSKDLFRENPEKTIYVIHTPPNNTNLDQTNIGSHAGSFAVREFTEQCQPLLTLHGHIHESVEVSGQFKEKIGKTLCLSPGNTNYSNQLAVLSFDLSHIQEVKRIII